MRKSSFWRDIWHLFCLVSLLPLAFALSSCLNFNRKDGPPLYKVDETKVPNAVPKVEPLTRLGNKSYKVKGRRYYPMKSSKGYDVTGTASWYGRKFHHRMTSSGEPYNMLAMTAAHKTLPLPTYIEVTNLKNHRKVIVKVNDRGPFSSDRILDLSYVAAKKLRMLGKGTAKVRIRAIDPREYNKIQWAAKKHSMRGIRSAHGLKPHRPLQRPTTPSHPKKKTKMPGIRSAHGLKPHKPLKPISKPKAATTIGTYMQVGAFKEKKYALRLQSNLKKMFHQPVIVVQPRTGSYLYRVEIGPMNNQQTVAKIKSRLNALGVNVRIKNGD